MLGFGGGRALGALPLRLRLGLLVDFVAGHPDIDGGQVDDVGRELLQPGPQFVQRRILYTFDGYVVFGTTLTDQLELGLKVEHLTELARGRVDEDGSRRRSRRRLGTEVEMADD